MNPSNIFFLAAVLLSLLLAGCSEGDIRADAGPEDSGTEDGDSGTDRAADGGDEGLPGDDGGIVDSGDTSGDEPPDPTVTVNPAGIDEVLYNPGMGFADFHFAWGNPPPIEEYPPCTVAYFRWSWADLEPSEGEYNFAMVDDVIARARAKGEDLAFRIMTEYSAGPPQWLLDKGVASVPVSGGTFPDYNDPVFLDYHERLVRAFGQRYAGSLDVDHVDIGSVGCWGEWNTACCDGVEDTCEQYYPTDANQRAIIDLYIEAFDGTPLVMLVGGPVAYAVEKGAGWRADCYGDYGIFSDTWNHMDRVYTPAAEDPVVGQAWKTAPVQFEVCSVIQTWYDLGFDIDLILQKGVEWHMSVINGKSSPIPAEWRGKFDEFLKKIGYRMVLLELTHTSQADPGSVLNLQARWENRGCAPVYHPWPLSYRLRSATDEVAASWNSSADLLTWLPGTHDIEDAFSLPGGISPGTYSLDVGILTEDGARAHIDLAIGGRRDDQWYPVSEVVIR
jgi:hypothetical protein